MRRYLVVFWLTRRRAVSFRVRARRDLEALLSVSGAVELSHGRSEVLGAQVFEMVSLWEGNE